LLAAFATWLARLSYEVPEQNLATSPRRIPALPRSMFLINLVGQAADSVLSRGRHQPPPRARY